MSKGEWKIDENDEAVFIDCEVAPEEADDDHEYSRWDELPDLVLEQVFSMLTMRERYYASMACWSWNRGFRLARSWHSFTLHDDTLTRRKFNYYYGWQLVLDHYRTQMCLTKVGRHFRHICFQPTTNFYNLFEFMNMISYFAERTDPEGIAIGLGPRVRSLRYDFPCAMAARDDSLRTFGTGGKMLEALKRLMTALSGLRHLALCDLLLEPLEAQRLLDQVCYSCCATLRSLRLVNASKVRSPLLHPGVLVNLRVLTISPQSLGADLLRLIGDHLRLRHLHLEQNKYTPDGSGWSAPASQWRAVRRSNPVLAVHLALCGGRSGKLVPQPGAPVRSVLYDSPHLKVDPGSVLEILDLYRNELRVFAHRGLPRFHVPRSFHERCDASLLQICRQCTFLDTLMVRERVSSCTVLLAAAAAPSMRSFLVRRNAVVLRCDWPRAPEWTDAFYQWLREASKSYDSVDKEVSLLLGRSWSMLTDRQFKLVELDLHDAYL